MKKIIIFTVTCIILLTFVSCGKLGDNTKDDELKGSLSLAIDPSYNEHVKKIISDFTTVNSKVTISIKNCNNPEQIVYSKENVDAIMIPDKDSKYMMNKFGKYFLNLSDLMLGYKGNFKEDRLKNITNKDKIYGVPIDSTQYFILYRKDVFNKVELKDIKTWNNYIENCKIINKNNKDHYYFISDNPENSLYEILFSELKINYTNLDKKLDIKSPEGIKVVQLMKKFKDEKMMLPIESKEQFFKELINGKLVSSVCNLKDLIAISKIPNMKCKFGVIRLPAFEEGGNKDVSFSGNNFMVNSSTKNKNLILQFLRFTIEDEKALLDGMFNYGILPSNKEIYKSKEIDKKLEYFNNQKIFLLASNINMQSKLKIYSKNYKVAKDILNKNLNKIYEKDQQIDKILKTINEEITKSKNTPKE